MIMATMVVSDGFDKYNYRVEKDLRSLTSSWCLFYVMDSNVWPKGINTQFIHKSHWSIGIESILPFNIGDIFNGVWSVSPEGFVFKGVKGFLLLVKLHLDYMRWYWWPPEWYWWWHILVNDLSRQQRPLMISRQTLLSWSIVAVARKSALNQPWASVAETSWWGGWERARSQIKNIETEIWFQSKQVVIWNL